ncbi:Uncharacterised protein [uncultured archaeon]|nr:Uncharacterised protein [uncultured archaeon]
MKTKDNNLTITLLFAIFSLAFLLLMAAPIIRSCIKPYLDPGPPPALKVVGSPSCCGDSICLLERHHE